MQDNNLGSVLNSNHQALQEQPLACALPQNDKIDSSMEWRDEAIKGHAATNREIASF
jgi:hypothetical protein